MENKPAQIAILIALSIASIQGLRNFYEAFVQPASYLPANNATQLAENSSLPELTEQYAAIFNAIQLAQTENQNNGSKANVSEIGQLVDQQRVLTNSILILESHRDRLLETVFFWCVGGCVTLLGIFLQKAHLKMFGQSASIVGIAEMLYWTSPMINQSITAELSLIKFWFSLATWLLLVIFGFYLHRFSSKQRIHSASG